MSARPRVRPFALFLAIALAVAIVPAVALAGTDVAPGQQGFEPTTSVVNPRNPSQVAVARGCTVTISNDFGVTFPIVRNTTLGCNGDPSLAWDSQNRLFVTHLDRQGADNELLMFAGQIPDTTTSGTLSYTPVLISADDGVLDDKQWLVADSSPNSPFRDNLYIVWTSLGTPSRIQFSRSTDQGANWSAPQVLSVNGEDFVWPSHLAVAPNGDLFVAYHTDTCDGAGEGSIQLLRDGNGGADFAVGTVLQRTTAIPDGDAQVSCNVQDGSGDEIPQMDSWMQGSVQPWVLPDPARAGNVYVVTNDDPNDAFASGDDADVVIARSTDHGQTFSAISRVDHGPGLGFALMPTAAIDQDGNIGVTWYDNRRLLTNNGTTSNNNQPNFLLDLYGTASNDGGQTFTQDFRVNDAPFDPDVNANCRFGALATNDCTTRIGEYNGVWSVDGIGYAVWTGNATPPAAPFPSDGAGNQTTMFDVFSILGAYRDALEPNESRDFAVVAGLGSDQTYNQRRLTLHSDTDVDVFEVTALQTGWIRTEVQFNEVVAGLEARAFDVFGNVLGSTSEEQLVPGSSLGTLAFPAVRNNTYFVEVRDPNAPNTFAPQSTYELTITNEAAPVPTSVDLVPTSDSGRSDQDDVTNDDRPTLRIRVDTSKLSEDGILFSGTPDSLLTGDDPGYKVRVLADGNTHWYAEPVTGQPGVFELESFFADGVKSVTARVIIVDGSDSPAPGTDHAVGSGGESPPLTLTIDTVAPALPSIPDLLPSSDTGGVNVDDVTTLIQPSLRGTVEARTLVRLLANGEVVGSASAGTDGSDGTAGDGLGAWQVQSEELGDAVYSMQATSEDLAGNISAPSSGLPVIVANQVLDLNGFYAATGDVTVDLAAGTAVPFPVPGGVVGIRGIPTVNLDSSGNALTTLGTAEDDGIVFTPTGSDSGRLSRSGASQLLRLSSVGGTLSVDPLAGVDAVTVKGTADPDTITATVDTVNSIRVGSLKTLTAPAGSTERVGIEGGLGVDSINVGIFDTVSELLFVNGGEPLPNKPNGDEMNISSLSPRPKMLNMNGPHADGSAFVSYPRTTANETRVDYVDVEKLRMLK